MPNGYMTCDECGGEYNTTLKYPCGNCEEMWQPTDDTLKNVPGEEIKELSLAKKLKYIELLGTKQDDSLKKVAAAAATVGVGVKALDEIKASMGDYKHSAFGIAGPSDIIEGKPAPEIKGGYYHIALNMKETNTDALQFPCDDKGNVIVPKGILQQCAENLDRLRAQRNDIRTQYRDLQRAHMQTLGQNPVAIRKAAIAGIMRKWDKFVARRRTIWDEPGLSGRQRAQRVRRCNEEATVIMHELLSAVMSGQLEELPGEPAEVG